MTHLCNSLALFLIMAISAGCGSDGSLQIETTATPPVSDHESTAIATLREREAEIDVDDSGHVRIVELVKSKATNDDLKLLVHFPHLEALDITGGEITEVGLVHLKQLKGLQRLYLNELPLTNDGLANLAGLTKLDVLSLRKTDIDDKGMRHLKKLKQLTVLNLSKTGITNNALSQIQGLKKLDTLVLADTAATGEGFSHLRALKNLPNTQCRSVREYRRVLAGPQ